MAESHGAALAFIGIFYVLMILPCVGIAFLGVHLINKLGRFPSKTPAIQMSVMFKLIVLEIVSMTLILVFFKVLVSE